MPGQVTLVRNCLHMLVDGFVFEFSLNPGLFTGNSRSVAIYTLEEMRLSRCFQLLAILSIIFITSLRLRLLVLLFQVFFMPFVQPLKRFSRR